MPTTTALQQKTPDLQGLRVCTLSDPAGTRTQDPYIKSVLLYQLSYGIEPFPSEEKRRSFFLWECKNR